MIPPLAIVQARMGSTRLPGKMLLPLGERPLVWWAWGAAVEAFGPENVVVAIPGGDANDRLAKEVEVFGGKPFRWFGAEWDVLGRFHSCAHRYRWHPDSVIVRVTPDDPFKDPAMMRRVAAGERLPVERGAEAFTLAQLDAAHARVDSPSLREHLTLAVFPLALPSDPLPGETVDTMDDYRAAQHWVAITGGRVHDFERRHA